MMTEKKETKKTSKDSIFKTLSKIDVSHYTDKKMGLSYLSWAKAWGLVKAVYPNVTKHITEYPEFLPSKDGWVPTGRNVDYRLTPFGCEVEVTVDIEGNKYSSNLYVMNYKNQAVKDPKRLDFQQINKTQQRCLVKALAYAGLGLNVYAGEDLPSEKDEKPAPRRSYRRASKPAQPPKGMNDTELGIWKHADKINDAVLKQYKVNYRGTQTLMIYVVRAVKNGNQDAQKFSDNFKGKDKIAFDEITKRKLVA